MKTKPITLILTLLFCLSGSLYSGEDKNRISEHKKFQHAYDELISIQKKYSKSLQQISEIEGQLYELYKESPEESKNRYNFEYTTLITPKFRLVKDKIQHFKIFLDYENAIYQPSITNVNLLAVHSISREWYFTTLLSLITYVERSSKNMRVNIQNTTAVIAINKNLEILTKLKKWAELNKDTPNKFKQKKNEN